MVSIPSGLVTFFVRLSALSTLIRFIRLMLVFVWVWPAGAEGAASRTVVVLGDSLSAGYGIKIQEGWVTLLSQRLASEGYGYKVVNASVSGETTSGGLARLPAALDQHHPQIVLIELGGNDGLRGLPVKNLRDNLRAMVERSRKAGAHAVLFEMRIPPNYGPTYADAYQQAFHDAARTGKAALVPFFLGGILDRPGMFQDDGIHPTLQAQTLLLDAVWPTLKTLLH
jgi:acyl-CoA thioesterase I